MDYGESGERSRNDWVRMSAFMEKVDFFALSISDVVPTFFGFAVNFFQKMYKIYFHYVMFLLSYTFSLYIKVI